MNTRFSRYKNVGAARSPDEESDRIFDGFAQTRPTPDDVLAEIGLYLVIVLGIVIAVNFALGALHVV